MVNIHILTFSSCLLMCFACTDVREAEAPYDPWSLKVEKQGDFYLPEDLEIQLWAESPMLHNPTNIDVDQKGRVWVVEAVNYRDFNNSPDKYLNFGKGDRVIILDDTNNDGKADSSIVFVQDVDLRAPLGIAILGKQVIVSTAPHMIIYTDEDGDDKPDKKEIFLTGFGGYDHDHSLHSLVAGPDGMWYFNTGNAGPHHVQDKSGWTLRSGSNYTGGTPYNLHNEGNQKSDDKRVWVGGLALRVQPDGKGLEVLAHNFRNAYELSLDSYGNMWQSDNDDQVVACRVSYVLEGGNAGYFSEDGTRTWQADQKPGQSISSAHWHQEDPGVIPAGDISGAGSPAGFLVYEGDELGPAYRGMLLSAEAGRNVIFAYRPEMKGAGFGLARQDLLTTIGESTETYKWNEIFHDQRRWFRPSDLAAGTDGSLFIADWFDPVVGGHQMHDSIGYGRIFRVTPKKRSLVRPVLDLGTTVGQIAALCNPAVNVRNAGYVKLVEQGEQVIPAIYELVLSDNPYHRARATWLLAALGDAGIKITQNILQAHPDPNLRVTAYRALKRLVKDKLNLAQSAATDPSAAVRREVALSMRDFSWEETGDILLTLSDHYPVGDRTYLEALGLAATGKESELYVALLSRDQSDPIRWSEKMADICWRLHPPEAADALFQRAGDQANIEFKNRNKAINALAFIPSKVAANAMLTLANQGPKDIQSLASFWLVHRKSNDWIQWSENLPLTVSRNSALITEETATSLINLNSFSAMAVEEILKLRGNIDSGRELVKQSCIRCHMFDEIGSHIGPDLSSIGTKFDLASLLDALIYPSAAITFGYEAYIIETTRQERLLGFLVGDGQTKVLKDLTGKQHVIPAEEVISKKLIKSSIMPIPEELGLSPQDLADIAQYLLSLN